MEDILAILMAPDDDPGGLPEVVETVSCAVCAGTGTLSKVSRRVQAHTGFVRTTPCTACQGLGATSQRLTLVGVDTVLDTIRARRRRAPTGS
jgi:hypothetical protein